MRNLFVEEIEQSIVRADRCRFQPAFDKSRDGRDRKILLGFDKSTVFLWGVDLTAQVPWLW